MYAWFGRSILRVNNAGFGSWLEPKKWIVGIYYRRMDLKMYAG